MKYVLTIFSLLAISSTLFAEPTTTQITPRMPTSLDIAKNADGSVKHMDQADAVQYCACETGYAREKLGCTTAPGRAYLPSARELAQLTMSLGARGIVASCDSDDKCYSVNAKNADGSRDNFNFSYAGFQRPAGDFGSRWLMSSSDHPVFKGEAFVLDIGNGLLTSGVLHFKSPDFGVVHCVSGH